MAGPAGVLPVEDPAFRADPYPVLAALRERAPMVAAGSAGDGPGTAWLVGRHAEVAAALRDRRLGRVLGPPAAEPAWPAFAAHERWALLNLEPPDHTRIRTALSRAFTARAVADLADPMAARARALLDAAGPRFDLILDVAQPFSIGVICALLGVPERDAPQLLAWSHAIVKMYERAVAEPDQAAAEAAAATFTAYALDVLASRRRRPDGGLISALAGGELSDHEIACTIISLLNAGHEATVNTVGNGVRALLANRPQWSQLVAGEASAGNAVEELLRWDAPLQLFSRWVLVDGVELGGVRLARGDRLDLLLGAANRDPRRWADPDRFDVSRGDGGHVSFGGGIHHCLGAPLARLELTVLLEALLAAAPGLDLVAEPVFAPTFVLRGLTGLQVRRGPGTPGR